MKFSCEKQKRLYRRADLANLIVTRPQEQAAPTMRQLEVMGHTPMNAPMSSVEPLNFPDPPEKTALIVTSRNGALYGLKAIDDKTRAVYAVGEKTAEVARYMGFENVHVGQGTAQSMLPALYEYFQETLTGFSHLCGEELAFDIAAGLQREGVNASSHVVYRMVPTIWIEEDIVSALDEGAIDGVLFYSAKAAENFETLMAQASRFQILETLTAYTLSPRVARALTGQWKEIKRAAVPREEALFALLDS